MIFVYATNKKQQSGDVPCFYTKLVSQKGGIYCGVFCLCLSFVEVQHFKKGVIVLCFHPSLQDLQRLRSAKRKMMTKKKQIEGKWKNKGLIEIAVGARY